MHNTTTNNDTTYNITNDCNTIDTSLDEIASIILIIANFLVIITPMPQIIFSITRKSTNDLSAVFLILTAILNILMTTYGVIKDEWGLYALSPIMFVELMILLILKYMYDKRKIDTLEGFNGNKEMYESERISAMRILSELITHELDLIGPFSQLLTHGTDDKTMIITLMNYVRKIDQRVTYETALYKIFKNVLRDVADIKIDSVYLEDISTYYLKSKKNTGCIINVDPKV